MPGCSWPGKRPKCSQWAGVSWKISTDDTFKCSTCSDIASALWASAILAGGVPADVVSPHRSTLLISRFTSDYLLFIYLYLLLVIVIFVVHLIKHSDSRLLCSKSFLSPVRYQLPCAETHSCHPNILLLLASLFTTHRLHSPLSFCRLQEKHIVGTHGCVYLCHLTIGLMQMSLLLA